MTTPSRPFDGDAARACIRLLETEACKKDGERADDPCTRVCKSKG